jgi:hypothetical protein
MVYGAVGCMRNGPVYNKLQIFALECENIHEICRRYDDFIPVEE